MRLRSLLFVAVCALSMSIAAAQAPNPWSILLYNTADGALVRVDLDGGVETYDLGLSQPPPRAWTTSMARQCARSGKPR